MGLFDGAILGIVQGLTEFIPVSSSGHLILAREIFGISLDGSLAFDVVLHFATALAILVYFWKDIRDLVVRMGEQKILWGALVFGTIPAVVVGLALPDGLIEQARNADVVIWALIAGSALFVIAELLTSRNEQLTTKKGFLIGLYQILAFIPGFSRSGATISGGLLFNLSREQATRFAFLLGFPILIAIGSVRLLDLVINGGNVGASGSTLTISAVIAFAVGLGAIHFMIRFLRTHRLYIFALYRVILALVVFLFL